MTGSTPAAGDRSKLSVRTGSSRKLLARKAIEKATVNAGAEGELLEASFPSSEAAREVTSASHQTADAGSDSKSGSAGNSSPLVGDPQAEAPVTGEALPQPPMAAAAPVVPTPPATWSSEDESALQNLLARRKAVGYRRRGRDVTDQRLCVGDIKPNPGTVVATIVSLVAERGGVTRADLLDAMVSATFPHSKAKPEDRGWCQGYVAGAIRDGYLAVSLDAAPPAQGETS